MRHVRFFRIDRVILGSTSVNLNQCKKGEGGEIIVRSVSLKNFNYLTTLLKNSCALVRSHGKQGPCDDASAAYFDNLLGRPAPTRRRLIRQATNTCRQGQATGGTEAGSTTSVVGLPHENPHHGLGLDSDTLQELHPEVESY